MQILSLVLYERPVLQVLSTPKNQEFMQTTYKNEQNDLALQFHLMDVKLSKASHEAVLAIRRLNFISRIPLIDQKIRQDTQGILNDTVFMYVPSTSILVAGGYFLRPTKN